MPTRDRKDLVNASDFDVIEEDEHSGLYNIYVDLEGDNEV